MARIMAVANQKGGVGKTTTSVNLAAALAAAKRRVLLVDLDPQGNATMGSGIDKHDLDSTVLDLLMGEAELASVVARSDAGYNVIPSNDDLTAAEVGLLEIDNKEYRLRDVLEPVRGQYDFIVIDCPPSLNMLTVNSLAAADEVIIPMQCEYYALEGLTALMNTVEKIRAVLNPKLEIGGLLRTMFDPRNSLANEVSGQLESHFGDKVFRTLIPRNVRLAEAPSHGQPVITYDDKSRGALAYLTLAGEILRRVDAQAARASRAS